MNEKKSKEALVIGDNKPRGVTENPTIRTTKPHRDHLLGNDTFQTIATCKCIQRMLYACSYLWNVFSNLIVSDKFPFPGNAETGNMERLKGR